MKINCIAIQNKTENSIPIKEYIEQNSEFHLIKTFSDKEEASHFIRNNNIEIVFTSSNNNYKWDFFFADTNGKRLKINHKDLVYIESAGNYLTLHGINFNAMVYKSMHALLQILPSSLFIRVHKSYIISINYIYALKGNTCILRYTDKSQNIPIGKTYKHDFFNRINLSCD